MKGTYKTLQSPESIKVAYFVTKFNQFLRVFLKYDKMC